MLHVDDDEDFADLVAEMLERRDERFTVTTATDAGNALDRLDEGLPDCVVSDYDMPGTTGIEFLEQVRERWADLPFILYTGKGSEEVASRAISSGVTDYLQKATGRGEYELLANRVENAVSQYRAERALERSEQRLRTVIDNIPHPVFVVDADLEYVVSNPEHAAAHGMTVDAVEGRPASQILDADSYDSFATDVRRVMEQGESETFPNVEIPGPDGDLRVYDSRLVPISTVERETAVLGIAVDVTERETA